jgi:hypothetical protein
MEERPRELVMLGIELKLVRRREEECLCFRCLA